MFRKMGPGVLVAAAFIGPGTVTTCTLAGVSFGYSLLWAMLLSVLATMVLQEMSARLGIITQKGLAEVIKQEISNKYLRTLVVIIILSAIVIGNAAYEAGNIGGGILGLEAILGNTYTSYFPFVIGIIAFVLLYIGNYKLLEKVFISLVILMSLSFVLTALLTRPNIVQVLKGLFVPKVDSESLLTVIALVGTTVVPYNLFLHASLVSEKWNYKSDLKYCRRDTFISILFGGFVSICIIISAASIDLIEVTNVMDMTKALEPLYGAGAKYFMGIGLFAAGVTSAITAPLAAAYVAASCFGWKNGFKDFKFRLVWILILILGVFFLSFEIRPIEVIKFAQVANGILLPFIAIFLLWVVNRVRVMGENRNTIIQNTMGLTIVLLSILLGAKSILKVFEIF